MSSSSSGRCTLLDLWHDIKQELDGAGIMLDPEQKPTLLQLCLQCDKGSLEQLDRREVCPHASFVSCLVESNVDITRRHNAIGNPACF